MLKTFPLKSPLPDSESLRKVLKGEKEPEKVHFVEILIDEEVKKFTVENLMGEKYVPPAHGLFGASMGGSKTDPEAYWRQHINFFHRMGYDFVPDLEHVTTWSSLLEVKKVKDTAILSRGERHWAQEGKGMITSWEDFEKFPWKKIERITLDLESYFKFLSRNLPEGMEIAVINGGVHEAILEFVLGYEGLFCLIYDQPDLVEAVFERWGKMVYDFYRTVAPLEKVGVIFHGDDLGYKTGTLLSPEHLRRWVFPWFKKYASLAHQYGKMYWYHACGNNREIMEDLIEDVKVDAFHSFQDVIIPVIEFKEEYGGRIATLGGVDMDKLCRLDEQSLRAYVRNILDKCMPGGRYALGSGNSIANYVPIKNYLAMLEEGLKWNGTRK